MQKFCLLQGAVRDICKEIDGLVCKSGKVKMTDMIRLPPPDLYEHVEVRF